MRVEVSALLDDLSLLGLVHAVRYTVRHLQSLAVTLRTGLKLTLPSACLGVGRSPWITCACSVD